MTVALQQVEDVERHRHAGGGDPARIAQVDPGLQSAEAGPASVEGDDLTIDEQVSGCCAWERHCDLGVTDGDIVSVARAEHRLAALMSRQHPHSIELALDIQAGSSKRRSRLDIRAQARWRAGAGRRESGEAVLRSRNGNDVSDGYPEIAVALPRAATADLLVDGEIVAFDRGRTSFSRLQARIHLRDARIAATGVRVYFYVFDLLQCDGHDLTRLPLRTRKRLLRKVLRWDDPLRMSTHRNATGEAYYAYACRHGWEGIIAKRANAPYRQGRSPDWLKMKCAAGQEFVIGGFTEPKGSRVGLGALLVGYYEADRLRYAGKVGTGFGETLLTDLRHRLDRLDQGRSPFADEVREANVHWVRPELVAQVGFSEWTRDGRLRHPRFEGLRQDKTARDVVRERA